MEEAGQRGSQKDENKSKMDSAAAGMLERWLADTKRHALRREEARARTVERLRLRQ